MQNVQTRRRGATLRLAQFAILLAIEALVCFTPLGSLPIGPLVATLAHIPVIITAVTLGVGAGTAMGFFTGLFSFIVWSFMPPNAPLAFVFTPFYAPGNFLSLVICFVPRILIGTFSALVFTALNKLSRGRGFLDIVAYFAAGVAGSLTNTVLVLGGIYVFFGRQYAAANNIGFELLLGAIMGVVATNGVLELTLGAVCTYFVCKPVRKFVLKNT